MILIIDPCYFESFDAILSFVILVRTAIPSMTKGQNLYCWV